MAADAYLVCLGSYSPVLMCTAGDYLPIYAAKGYAVTIPVDDQAGAPMVSITVEQMKLVMSRLGDRLRVAKKAELNGYDTAVNPKRCEATVNRVFDLFPAAGRRGAITFWTGLRPSTPSNVPIIGRSRFPNLYLNNGHGRLGWAMSFGSGNAIADLTSGGEARAAHGCLMPRGAAICILN